MNRIITTDGSSHKRVAASAISMLIIIVWIIFSVIYIIQDRWQDYQFTKLKESYQKGYSEGVTNSVRALMADAPKCNKIPLYYGDTTVEVVAVSCLSASKEDGSSAKTSAGAKPAAPKEEPKAEQPTVPENPNEPKAEQPSTPENPNEPKVEQPTAPANQ